MLKFLFSLSGLLVSIIVAAQLKLPALISDNMVLQQNKQVSVWGWAAPGEMITITLSWNNKAITTKADDKGKWQATLQTTKAGGPYTIEFKSVDKITVNNVLLGEVWLASGQSNMEFPMGKGEGWRTGAHNAETEIPKANYPHIRMIDVPNRVSDMPQEDFKGGWQVCTPETVKDFSAVAYFFAKEIQAATGYPIGIINSTWGGTPAESWTRKDILESDTGFQKILERYQQDVEKYPAAYAKYKTSYEKWKADTSSNKKGAPKEPVGPNHNKSPGKLYNGMIAPLIPYTLQGVIWYQGESNADRAWQYRRLFPAMIKGWREDWHNNKLPFYFVQIAPHRSQGPEIREAQLYSWQTTPYTGMVVSTDYGDSLDIHPRNKEVIGKRLSLWALKNQYGKNSVVTSGPVYQSMKVESNKIVILFKYADGINASSKAPLQEFLIAGDDQQFVPAQAIIKGNTVIVWNNDISKPVAVRFNWSKVPVAELYNKAGLPATPFRTDSWPVATQGKD